MVGTEEWGGGVMGEGLQGRETVTINSDGWIQRRGGGAQQFDSLVPIALLVMPLLLLLLPKVTGPADWPECLSLVRLRVFIVQLGWVTQ